MTSEKKAELEGVHDKALSRRHGNRIKVIFLVSEGWKPVSIAQALRLTEETVRKPIRAHVAEGVHNRLHRNGFFYKKPKGIPGKADPAAPAAFACTYKQLKRETPENEPISFGDGVHPTISTKVTGVWVGRGKEYPIPTTGSRTRLNITGALNLKTMTLVTSEHQTIDGAAILPFRGRSGRRILTLPGFMWFWTMRGIKRQFLFSKDDKNV